MAWRGVPACAVAAVLAGCGGSGERPAATPAVAVTGPLCDVLPTGDDPGAPPRRSANARRRRFTWIPVVTTFEAAVRASGLARYLRGVTILAPTDDAFAAAFDRQRLDDLLLKRKRELRALLEAHIVNGKMSLAALRNAGNVTTLAGDPHLSRRRPWRGSATAPRPSAPTTTSPTPGSTSSTACSAHVARPATIGSSACPSSSSGISPRCGWSIGTK